MELPYLGIEAKNLKSMNFKSSSSSAFGNIYFGMPIDFSNIKNNRYAQRALRRLHVQFGTDMEKIENIVSANMQAINREKIELGRRRLERAEKNGPDNKGYLNTPDKIELFWNDMASMVSRDAISWLETNVR